MQLFIVFSGCRWRAWTCRRGLPRRRGSRCSPAPILAEIWRGCVESVSKGQWEASASLAMRYTEQMRYVILPQALRIAIPPTVGFSVQVVKGTAVASIIGFAELTKTGSMLANAFQPFAGVRLRGARLLSLCYPLSLHAKHLERKFHVAR